MPVILDSANALHQPYTYTDEKTFEVMVVQLADHIFGPNTIYVDVKKQVRGKHFYTIPDGYVIDCTEPGDPRLFVIENEIVSHDAFNHIGVQMLRFVTSFEDAKVSVRQFLMEEIHKDPAKLDRLEEGCSRSPGSRNIDAYLDAAVYGPFRGIVVIDEARPELHKILEKINADISVLELKTYKDKDGTPLHLFDTLYEEFEEEVAPESKRAAGMTRQERRLRRAQCDTIVVPAQEEGFKETYLGQNRWYAIRISAAMKDRIKYIAAYQVKPVSAVTYIAEVESIKPYANTGKYAVFFKGTAEKIGPIKPKDYRFSPQGPVYVKREELLKAKALEEALR